MQRFYNYLFIVITGFLLIFILSCEANQKNNTDNNILIQQQRSDLLAGEVKAISYSGFRHGQHPDRGDGAINPTKNEILEDLKIISKNSNFKLLRLYDSQENSEAVIKIIHEEKLNLKVMLGIWLNAEISNHEGCPWLTEPIPQAVLEANKLKNKKEIDRAIKLAQEYKDIIVAVNVGNEALVSWNDHMVTVDSVISYVRRVQKSIHQLVTVAENYKWWAMHGRDLAKEVDFIAIHTYPLWENKDIDEGLSYTIANIEEVLDSLSQCRIVISEAGWATIATEFSVRASEEKQKRYYNELMLWAAKMNITTFWFEAFDEDWKGNLDDPQGAEKHWGLFTVDRKAKLVMYDEYPERIPEKIKR
jgi:exo-beta-1,3-glucanase (GH17 family)